MKSQILIYWTNELNDDPNDNLIEKYAAFDEILHIYFILFGGLLMIT